MKKNYRKEFRCTNKTPDPNSAEQVRFPKTCIAVQHVSSRSAKKHKKPDVHIECPRTMMFTLLNDEKKLRVGYLKCFLSFKALRQEDRRLFRYPGNFHVFFPSFGPQL